VILQTKQTGYENNCTADGYAKAIFIEWGDRKRQEAGLHKITAVKMEAVEGNRIRGQRKHDGDKVRGQASISLACKRDSKRDVPRLESRSTALKREPKPAAPCQVSATFVSKDEVDDPPRKSRP
jgi:hypothetical protein